MTLFHVGEAAVDLSELGSCFGVRKESVERGVVDLALEVLAIPDPRALPHAAYPSRYALPPRTGTIGLQRTGSFQPERLRPARSTPTASSINDDDTQRQGGMLLHADADALGVRT
jgi:hypothetical protein